MSLMVRCPAKVNLYLRVGLPDESGYHPVTTMFQAVGLCDTLILDAAAEDSIVCNWDGLPAENTLTKALRLLRELVAVPPIRIRLEKRIPEESGLGGGSSDAAGLLRGIDHLFPSLVPPRHRDDVARAVGADVPFFLHGGRAIGRGRGDVVEPLPDVAQEWYLIIRPRIGVSTAEAYAALDATDRSTFAGEPSGDPAEWLNDFELVMPDECTLAKAELQRVGARRSMLCGSGSGVYGVFESEERAERASFELDRTGLTGVWPAPGLTREESLWMC